MKLSDFHAQQPPQKGRVTCEGMVVLDASKVEEIPQEAVDYVQDLETDLETARLLLYDLIDEMESVLKRDERLRLKGDAFLGINQRKDITQSIVTVQEFLDQWVESEPVDKNDVEVFYA